MFPLNAHRDKNKSRELWRKTGVSVKFLFGSEAELSTHTATLHTHSQAYVDVATTYPNCKNNPVAKFAQITEGEKYTLHLV